MKRYKKAGRVFWCHLAETAVLGALLLAASLRLLFWFLVACLVHELGHWGAIRALGGTLEGAREYAIRGMDYPHQVLVIRKTAHTLGQYPRRFAKISANPL